MILWKPNGLLNVATEPTDLPEQTDGHNVISDALVRFKNLRADLKGVVKTRDGSSKINETAFSSATELVTNGTFTSDVSDWADLSTGAGSISWSAGTMQFSATGSSVAIAQQDIAISDTNVAHTLSFGITTAGGPVEVVIGTTAGGNELYGPVTITDAGTHTASVTPTASTIYIQFIYRGNPDTANIDNVSLKRSVDPVNLIVEQGGVRYEFAGTSIFRNEASLATGLTDDQWSAILYNSFNDTNQSVFALNGTDRKRITGSTVAEWGIAAPSNIPTLGVGTGTGLTGSYNAKYTYCRKVGSTVVAESNPSSAAASAQSLSNQALEVNWTASSDAQVTHVRIYRTTAGGSLYFHDQDIAIGTVTVDTTTADSALGSEVETDHNRPPLGSVVLGPAYNGTSFILKDNNLYYSKPKQPEYWPTLYFIEVSQLQFPLKTGVFQNGQLYCLTTHDIYYIQGGGHGTFFPIPMRALTGAQGQFGAIAVAGRGIYHTGPDGVYLYSTVDRKITEDNLEPLFRGEDVQGMPGVSDMTNSWLHQDGNRLYFGYVSDGYDHPTNILVFNLDNGRLNHYEFNDGDVIEISCITSDKTNKRILVGDAGGFVRVIEDKSVTTDSGEAINWVAQSKDYTLQTRAHFPRLNKYDVDASSATTCNGYLLLDGSVHQTHAITENRNTKRRLVDTGNGERCALRLDGSGPVSIYAVESE